MNEEETKKKSFEMNTENLSYCILLLFENSKVDHKMHESLNKEYLYDDDKLGNYLNFFFFFSICYYVYYYYIW